LWKGHAVQEKLVRLAEVFDRPRRHAICGLLNLANLAMLFHRQRHWQAWSLELIAGQADVAAALRRHEW
jgi:hypothetical protein